MLCSHDSVCLIYGLIKRAEIKMQYICAPLSYT